MIEMASSRPITKVSRVFPWVYTYTSRVNRSREVDRLPGAWMGSILGHLRKVRTCMMKTDWSYVPLVCLFGLSMALAPVFHAQDQGALTRITTVPEGATYLVDGQVFNHSSSA